MAEERSTPPASARAAPAGVTASPGSAGRPVTAVSAGTRIIGTYEIERLISTGGMGEVYRGRNIHNGEPVAIKIVLPHLANDEMIVQLFQKEAKILGRLFHEAIVRYHVFTNDPEIGRPCIVMEFVEGTSLNDVIRRGPLPAEDVKTLLRRLAGALDKAHTVGVVHRDLSPDNVILEDGQVAHAKIIDFGIAKSSMKGDATLLQGQFAGKFGYVAPEQLGAFGGQVDGRTDIYSLGLMMVAVSQGRALNMGKSIVEAVRARAGIPDLAGVDPGIRPLLEHMLEPNPENRPPTMAAVVRLLDHPDEIPARGGEAAEDDDRTRIIPALPPTAAQAATRTVPGTAAAARPADVFVGVPGAAPAPAPAPAPRRGKGGLIAAAAVVVLGAAGAGAWFAGAFGPAPEEPDKQSAAANGGNTAPTASAAPGAGTASPGTAAPGGTGTAAESPVTTTPPAATGTASAGAVQTGGDPAATGTAGTTPAAAVTPPPTDPRGRQLAWVRAYDGGPCVHVAPLPGDGDRVALDVYATSVEPAAALLAAFRDAHGLEPAIGTRVISDPQCPVIDFLNRRRGARALPVGVTLDNGVEVIRSGEAISGRIEGLAGRAVSLFLVNGSGAANNLREWVTAAADGSVTFTFSVNLAPGQQSTPQLLLAIATDQPVTKLDAVPNGVTARALIPFVESQMEAARQEPVAAVTYFRLEN